MTLQLDKLKHLAVGLVVACGTYAVTGDLRWTWAAVLVVATVKEAVDATGRGHVELRDWVATIWPAMLPTLWAWRDVLGVW